MGVPGEALRLEALVIDFADDAGLPEGALHYGVHLSGIGWQGWRREGARAGTEGESRRIEAFQMRLDGELARHYDVYYRAHVQNVGWMAWARNGEVAGTVGSALRLEALEIVLVDAGGPAPDPAGSVVEESHYGPTGLTGSAHVQNLGWRGGGTGNVLTVGTTGKALRLEALRLSFAGLPEPGGIAYRAHVQNEGWQTPVLDGALAGSVGLARRLEGLRVSLYGEAAAAYDLFYRVHVAQVGWLQWAQGGSTPDPQPDLDTMPDGELAGSEGLALGVEAAQFALVDKGAGAPAADDAALPVASIPTSSLISGGLVEGESQWREAEGASATLGDTGRALYLDRLKVQLAEGGLGGHVSYRVHTANVGWQDWVSDGAETQGGGRTEAVEIKLEGDVSKVYDLWYRAHVQDWGWLGWTKGGAAAGSTGAALRLECLELRLVSKGQGAPGSTSRPIVYHPPLSGDSTLDDIVWTIIRSTGTGWNGLRNAYNYIKAFPYISMSHWPGDNWRAWSVPFAKEMWLRHGGNCYRYAALMTWVARGLGYDAVARAGWLPTRLGGQADHGWCEVHLNGGTYVIDTELATPRAYPDINWFMITYGSARVRYHDLAGRLLG